ncbi:MAG: hypothetical protein ACXVCO_14630 [Ktedonobacterales bacterium]
MDTTATDETWRLFTDPHGYFHIEIPDSWRVEQTDGPRFLRNNEDSWTPHTFMTRLTPAVDDIDIDTRRIGMTIRIDQYAETPPSIKGLQDPTDLAYIRTYRVVHDGGWLVVTVGHLRIDIQYQIQHMSHAYRPMGWEPPAPLSPDEQHKRLALIQRIIASFDLLTRS